LWRYPRRTTFTRMRAPFARAIPLLLLAVACARSDPAAREVQRTSPAISARDLRLRLFAISDDSMMGRESGSEGDYRASEYVRREFERLKLTPAGENGSYFQNVPFFRDSLDPASVLRIAGRDFTAGADFLSATAPETIIADGVQIVYGGDIADSARWPSTNTTTNRIVVLTVAAHGKKTRSYVPARGLANRSRFRGAIAIVVGELELADASMLANYGRRPVPDTSRASGPEVLIARRALIDALIGSGPQNPQRGMSRSHAQVRIRAIKLPSRFPARNVIAVLRGRDSALATEFVSISAHHDHVGFNRLPVDHDSMRTYLRTKRPLGVDSPDSPSTPEEIRVMRRQIDSVRRLRHPRLDSIFNGADDDGSGTVALLEIAEELSSRKVHPRRSIMFISHTGEEEGLVGSAWFTDHPTISLHSIVGEIDMDMVGRGDAADLPGGGPTYFEPVGSKRLSRAFGELLEKVNASEPLPFVFDYSFDAPGDPLNYYCRADHYNYARYGIPSISLSRGEHLDYHQVTDEAQYIDYDALARVAVFVRDAAEAIADHDARFTLDHKPGDPHAPCRQ
jgi:hypothetical protein